MKNTENLSLQGVHFPHSLAILILYLQFWFCGTTVNLVPLLQPVE